MDVMKKFLLKYGFALLIAVNCLHINIVSAQFAEFATFEIGDATLSAYSTTATEATPFTSITFDGEFENPPNVFVMTPQFGADPCVIRINNVTETGFDATCLEPLSENRNSPGVTFEYIAIQDGGVTVPLSSGTGNVIFESNCQDITDQQWGNRCGPCSGSESFEPISFTNTFSTTPAVIAQIQTVANENMTTGAPTGEPAFISTAIGNNPNTSVSTTGFNLAIERHEAGSVALLGSAETICYLAAETSATCQSLDFSSIGGPSMPVMFQALNSTQQINGQESSGETTNFAASCFSSTPLALAAQITRNGGDGSFIRRIGVTTAGITLIVDEDTIEDNRNHGADEQASIMAFGQAFTNPVTLSGARVSVLGRRATFSWDTTAETFNLGFNLWGETTDGWVQLNRRLIKGSAADTDQLQSYRRTIRLSRNNRDITQFGISSVDSTGYEEFYGPFSEGQDYGDEANNEPVDWTATRNQFEQLMRERGFTKINNRWRRLSSQRQARIKQRQLGLERNLIDLNVEASGIHRIGVDQLLALSPSWNRVQLDRLALTLNGRAVPREIISNDDRLDSSDTIIFNASEVSGQDTPFLENYTYRLSINAAKAVDANVFNGIDVDQASVANSALISDTLTSRKLHSAGLTTGDPWYDARLLSVGNPASTTYQGDFAYAIDETQVGVLDVVLFGGLDLPGDTDDHHIQINVNDQLVHDVTFDGLIGYEQRLVLPAGLVKTSGNIVTVTVVGDTGLFADVVLVDEVTLSAYSSLSDDPRLSYDFAHSTEADAYQVANNTNQPLSVYAYTSTGLLSSVQTIANDDSVSFTALPFEVSDSSDIELRYSVANIDSLPTPTLSLTQGEDLHSQEADYLIIAHPSFIGDELNEFVQFKTELGHNVRVVDWLEIVNTYGFGNNTPRALNKFLRTASELYQIDNVLIVGGHTFDYFGITNESIVNFVPSHYRAVSVFEYTATDNPYADLNGDNIPELAIGRWPVRSVDELSLIIKKTKDWHQNRQDNPYQDAYLLGQSIDGQNLNFAEQLNNRVKAPLLTLDEIDQINQLFLDELPDGVTDVVSYTRQQLAEQINGGTDLISFSGHASPTAWGFQNIINTSFIQSLENQGDPILLMPLACFITHYESVSTNTLAHQWLFSGDRGAAAIHGASVLGEYRENGLFAQRYLNQSKTSNTVGEAIKKAKQQLGSGNEILHNWVLLGDPTLPIR